MKMGVTYKPEGSGVGYFHGFGFGKVVLVRRHVHPLSGEPEDVGDAPQHEIIYK